VLQAVSYLIEWAKHIITLAAALMVLSATVVKELSKDVSGPMTAVVATSLVLFYVTMLGAVWLALRLIRYGARTVLTTSPELGSGDELSFLQSHLRRTQRAFLVGLTFFCLVALSILLAWTQTREGRTSPLSASTHGPATMPCSANCQLHPPDGAM
jgi:hypothetical protein